MLFCFQVIIHDRTRPSKPYRSRRDQYQQDTQEIIFEVPANPLKKTKNH